MLYIYLIAAYVLSVVVTIVHVRWIMHRDTDAYVSWRSVIFTLLPVVNLVGIVIDTILTLRDYPIPLPKWIIRLYGGR